MRSTPLLMGAAALLIACNRENGSTAQGFAKDRLTAQRAPAPATVASGARSDIARKERPTYPLSEVVVVSDSSSIVSASIHPAGDSVTASMLIRTGQASIEVDSLARGIRAARALAARVGGFVANSEITTGAEETHSATLEIKLPVARFDDAISGLQPIGQLESVSVNSQDVGEEYVDVAARAANGHRLEQRLVDILGTRTGKLSDVLAVERELARVREEIERQEGRMRYLRTRTAMSTLSLTVHEKAPVVAGTGSGGVIAEAFRQSWRNFIGFLASAIAAMGTLLPLGVTVGAIAWMVWRARRASRPASDTH
jgi:Domain of unknown function (DUF4349)